MAAVGTGTVITVSDHAVDVALIPLKLTVPRVPRWVPTTLILVPAVAALMAGTAHVGVAGDGRWRQRLMVKSGPVPVWLLTRNVPAPRSGSRALSARVP